VGAQKAEHAWKDVAECSVLFLGPRFGNEKEQCLRRCAGFVLPSLSEGVPMSVLEAWAHRKPVLITTACHLPEGIEAGAAIEIEPEAKSIRAGLEVLFGMTERERRTIGEAGYELVSKRYAWERVAAEMKGLYEFMLGGGPKPVCIADF
jgi:poly(glycerol-phosphate) alpha-glucosyltransferase